MKKLILIACALFAFVITGCSQQQGLKVGYVNCCVTQDDQSKKCVQLPQGDCKNTPGASIVTDCTSCK
jgi:hypothetical protein